MKPYLLLLIFGVVYTGGFSQAGPNQPARNYKPRLLRFDEDYSTLNDSLKDIHKWLRFKNIPLHPSQSIRTSIGVDYREMYELVERYGDGKVSDGYWLTRFMLHADLRVQQRIRLFAQLGRGIIAERKLPIRPIDEDQLFFLNAFAEYTFNSPAKSYLRLGRQELMFGIGRLVAPREGPNVRNTYDGARLHHALKSSAWDFFYTHTVDNQAGILDDVFFGDNQRLWGAYGNKRFSKLNVDLYYLGFYNPNAMYAEQVQSNPETRHSLGLRVAGQSITSIGYDAELVYQFGQFGQNSIAAWVADVKIHRTWRWPKSSLRPSAKLTYASGDRSRNNQELNTYNPLFPNLLYYQTAVGLFPANLINPQIALDWQYSKLNNSLGLDFFWRSSSEDDLYAPFGKLSFSEGNERYLGYQFYLKTDFEVNPNLSLGFLTSRYFKSDFIRNNNDRRGIELLLNLLVNYKL